jgi:CheY-like chemotaxis protein
MKTLIPLAAGWLITSAVAFAASSVSPVFQIRGFDELEWLRQRPDLNPLGVLVLSGSHWQADIDRAYALDANFYCTKPLDLKQLVSVAESLTEKCLSPSVCAPVVLSSEQQ